jgi:hypothetical protein
MKYILALILTLFPCATLADSPPANYTLVNSTTTTTAKVGPGIFYGVISLAAQVTVVSCFDSLTLSGTQIYANTPTVATLLGAPPGGISVVNGVTCAISTSVVAPGYLILTH